MTKFLLAVHVLAAVMAVGPVAVAASMFPPALRRARAESRETAGSGDPGDPGGPGGGDAPATLRTLHRICRVYAGVGLAVPVFGFATASSLGVLGSGWLIASIVLTAAAAGVLALLILPAQSEALAGTVANSLAAPQRLAMLTGVFNLLWATVTVLMIVRPGSTTGV
ncbi:hypothetical protein [Streptomyces sp. NPDC020917]|uniref:hypothetical protein n=1 Tax=Streptomyces sp. NPDC020917 TaxID=3365102 RepID=UPI00378BEF90